MEKTIYKKDSKGKVRYLTISTSHGDLIQTSGVLGTDNPIVHSKTCKPKNVGRSNETTATEQAISEAQSKVELKLREGYFETIKEAEEEGGSDFLLPMLAQDAKKHLDKIEWPCFVQPKLDGMRCLATPTSKTSRKNVSIDTMGHIDIGRPEYSKIVADGELYAHDLNFQENMRVIKKYRKGETEKVKYHIYDAVSELPFEERYGLAAIIVSMSTNCELVPTYKVENMEEVKKYHSQFLIEGYEGTIIRWGEEGYDVNKRSKYLLKYKDFIDESYEVVDVIANDADPTQGTLVCKIPKTTTTFKTGMKFSHYDRADMLKNKHKFIGQMAEIRFFEFSEDGIPRFPVCVGFRIDK